MKHDAVSITAVLVLAAFAIERITSAALFLLFRADPAASASAEQTFRIARNRQFAYFGVAGAIAAAVLLIGRDVRVLGALNFGADLGAGQTLLDFFLTWLVIVAGSDRIGELVASKHGATSVEAKPEPIKIEGSVFLVDAPDKAKVVAGRT